jgi:hypothetical protein
VRTKKDLILIGSVLCAALLVFFILRAGKYGKNPAAYVSVRVDGVETARYSMYENREIPLKTAYGSNFLVIESGTAKMSEADCPDRYCTQQHAITRAGETIICLPHHLVVEGIAAEAGSDPNLPDAVTG